MFVGMSKQYGWSVSYFFTPFLTTQDAYCYQLSLSVMSVCAQISLALWLWHMQSSSLKVLQENGFFQSAMQALQPLTLRYAPKSGGTRSCSHTHTHTIFDPNFICSDLFRS